MSTNDAKLLTLLICSVGALLAINYLYFPLSVPWMIQHTGGVPFLDAVPFRSGAKTYEMLDALGPIGRRNHLYFIWTIDLALPVLLGSFLYVAIRNGAERAFGASKTAGRLRWLAVAPVIADYTENISNSVLLALYPDRFLLLASMSGPLALAKFSLFGACVLIAISMFSVDLIRRRRTKPWSAANSPGNHD